MGQWWDAARIDATVTRKFVCQYLLPEEIERLDRPLAFGDGLTDETYWDWIDNKAKRIFLILVDLKIPDQIFGIIDDSWDDHDLPISSEHVERLRLTAVKDDKIERKFFARQFNYLLKPFQRGDHISFNEYELVPLEVVERRPAGNNTVDKVILPNCPGLIFYRRRIPLGNGVGQLPRSEFVEIINSIKGIQNDHLVSYHASYTQLGAAYVLFTPATDSNLKSFFGNTPSNFKNLPKRERRHAVMNWILCLADTLAYLHSRRLCHGNIKPSTILFTSQLHIFYSDFTRLNAEVLAVYTDKNSFDRESYDYAAPEQWFRPTGGPASPLGRGAAAFSVSTSPETQTNFSIPRNDNPSSPNAMLNMPNPYLNPQAADIFSLGCVILDLMSFLVKKTTKSFSAHRAAKHKTPGRGGAVLDSSFHKNLGQVESWMSALAKEASKKVSASDGGYVFRGIVPLMHIVARMLSANPIDRPSAAEVQTQVYQILTKHCDITEPHCVHQYGGWDFGISNLRIQAVSPNAQFMPQPIRHNSMLQSSRRGSDSLSGSISPRGLSHSRTNSSGGMSNNSGISSAASERDQERDAGTGFTAVRNIRLPAVRSPAPWDSTVQGGRGDQAPVY
ncbi:protein kinase domain-containing protein [Colletotrichum graminicola]|uniref:Protein kinase domain-containing protein n=1 Tax=Colletotrichum graminicola (strain M1.001 / M2 / FGSC 10212) TaxID=645133 RepID=E3QGF1_COLGM|nr:protein kinase domain-containing protein [Colletotrichum graminicola M1.001]EFQ29939.1 protein kinase domain-containing protein [Colletotrichum graminicola M1.001]WDK09921.1 protein kinase domain-containing protein [Colletotrichum graminicola]